MIHGASDIEYSIGWDAPIWYMSFAFLPHRCGISNKLIWLKYAYACTKSVNYGDGRYHDTTWRTREEHIIALLKGK